MNPETWGRGEYTITTDPAAIDIEAVLRLLAGTYWGAKRTREATQTAIEHSICFTLLRGQEQIGFARVVTDTVLFAWIADVIVAPEFRGQGLGTWLVECLLAHPVVSKVSTKLLVTRDAHTLYQKFGFKKGECMRMPLPPWATELP